MAMGPRLELRQSQSLVMTPQLQQAIKLLALSNLEIESFVAEEIERNPLLEAGEEREPADSDGAPSEPDSGGDGEAPEAPTADALIAAGAGAEDAPLDADYAADTFHHDSAADSGMGSSSGNADDEGVDFDSFAGPVDNLADHLMSQLGMILDGVDFAIARVIVDALDAAGYLTEPLRDIADRLGVPLARAEAALAAVQSCEPTGVGARSLSECLALQAKEVDRYDPCMKVLLDNLDLLASGRIAQLQRMCMVDDEDMADMIRELRGYDPKPGCRFDSTRTETAVPDVFVSRVGAGWRVEINSGTLPRVLLDRRYHAELAAGAKDRASKAWLSETLASANWLVKALDQRQRTIVTVTTEIVKQQEAFFLRGVAHLRPLTLKTVADAVGLHESTISRVTSNKYVGSARGVFELKYFFTSGVAASDGGEGASALAVKAAIKTLIAAETADAVLSDDTLVDLLHQQGFDLARRTVAKYREALGIGSSVQRRRAKAIDAKAA